MQKYCKNVLTRYLAFGIIGYIIKEVKDMIIYYKDGTIRWILSYNTYINKKRKYFYLHSTIPYTSYYTNPERIPIADIEGIVDNDLLIYSTPKFLANRIEQLLKEVTYND